MINVTATGATVVTGKHIQLYHLMALKQALVLESKGMKVTRGLSAQSIAKRTYGLKGGREKLIAQVQSMIDQFNGADEEVSDG